MPKKIILTEQQFNDLRQFIVESKFEDFISKNAKVNDIIRIEFKNSVNNFKVILNDNGQITMDNIDAGSANINNRYFMAFTGLDGNRLSIRKVNKTKEADKLKDPRSWKPETLNGVNNIELIRNGKVVDKVDDLKVADTPNQNNVNFDEIAKRILNLFSNEVREGNGVLMKMDNNENLLFCCVGKTNDSVTLELTSNTKKMALKNYTAFIIKYKKENDSDEDADSQLNPNFIKVNGKKVSLQVLGVSGETTKEIPIDGILDISITVSCSDSTKIEPEADEEPTEAPTDDAAIEEKRKEDAKRAMEMILKDETLKKAFYSQPSLWDLFVAELKGEKATGKGIVPVLNILDNYQDDKLGAKFNKNKQIEFKFVDDLRINFTHNNRKEYYTFDNDKEYKPKVEERKLGENQKLYGKINTYLDYQIELTKKIDVDTYLSKVNLIVKKGSEYSNSEYIDDVKIKIIRGKLSPGYNPIDETE